jgi:hypothetical protein
VAAPKLLLDIGGQSERFGGGEEEVGKRWGGDWHKRAPLKGGTNREKKKPWTGGSKAF